MLGSGGSSGLGLASMLGSDGSCHLGLADVDIKFCEYACIFIEVLRYNSVLNTIHLIHRCVSYT